MTDLDRLKNDLAVARRTVGDLEYEVAAAEAAIAGSETPPAPEPEPAPAQRIRLIGTETGAYRRHDDDLVVADSDARVIFAPGTVTLAHARDLVAAGKAAWIGAPA